VALSGKLWLILFAALAALGATRFFLLLPPLVGETAQIVNTGILLVILILYLVHDFRPRLADREDSNPQSLLWGAAGLVFGGVSLFSEPATLSLLALFVGTGCFLRAGLGVVLSRECGRLLNAVFAVFCLFGALLLALPLLDIPLRLVAGEWSAQLFAWLQQETDLGVVVREGEPMLILVVNGRPFHVAAECNGFGLLGTSLILNAAFIVYRRVGWLDSVLLLFAGLFLAVVGNLVRILIIVWLAPVVGDHYMLMHEIVGTIVFYACLGLQWWLLVGFGRPPKQARSEELEAG